MDMFYKKMKMNRWKKFIDHEVEDEDLDTDQRKPGEWLWKKNVRLDKEDAVDCSKQRKLVKNLDNRCKDREWVVEFFSGTNSPV